jgi:hypothetical protein
VVVAANGRTTAELTALAEATIVDASGARFDDPSLTLRYEGDATPLAAALSLVTVGFTGPTGMSAVALTPTTPASGDATVPTIVLSRLPERTGATYLLRGVLSGWTADEINGTSGWRRDVTVGGHRSVTLAWELDGALFVANGIDTADDQLSAVVASIGPVDDSTWATMLAATATRRAQTADSGGSSSNSGSVEVAPASTLVVVGEPSPSPVPTTPASSPAAPASTATP